MTFQMFWSAIGVVSRKRAHSEWSSSSFRRISSRRLPISTMSVGAVVVLPKGRDNVRDDPVHYVRARFFR
jgi:hypothetical protein